MTRRTIIAGNWKMYKTQEEALEFVRGLLPVAKKAKEREIFLAVPFTLIAPLVAEVKGSGVVIGGQNMNDASEGAFTGEIAAKMLLDIGAKFVLLGHSERRQLYGESDEWIQKKVMRALKDKLPPVLCIGENLAERQENKTEEVIRTQILHCLQGVSQEEMKKVILAYEPVWAIGTGMSATPEMAEETHGYCRKVIAEEWGEETASAMPILYGGSVKPENAKTLLAKENIDGLLVGGASLSLASFSKIVNDG